MKLLSRLQGLFYLLLLSSSLFLYFNGAVYAQSYNQADHIERSPENRSRVFEAVERMQVEEVSGAKLLLAAYALFWLLLFAYILRLARVQDRTHRDLDRLERLLANTQRPDHVEDEQKSE